MYTPGIHRHGVSQSTPTSQVKLNISNRNEMHFCPATDKSSHQISDNAFSEYFIFDPQTTSMSSISFPSIEPPHNRLERLESEK